MSKELTLEERVAELEKYLPFLKRRFGRKLERIEVEKMLEAEVTPEVQEAVNTATTAASALEKKLRKTAGPRKKKNED